MFSSRPNVPTPNMSTPGSMFQTPMPSANLFGASPSTGQMPAGQSGLASGGHYMGLANNAMGTGMPFGGASVPPTSGMLAGNFNPSNFPAPVQTSDKVFFSAKPSVKNLLDAAPAWRPAIVSIDQKIRENQRNLETLKKQTRQLRSSAASTFRALERKREEVRNLESTQKRNEETIAILHPTIQKYHKQSLALQQNYYTTFNADSGVDQPLLIPSTDYFSFLEDLISRAKLVLQDQNEVVGAVTSMKRENGLMEQLKNVQLILKRQTLVYNEYQRFASQLHQKIRSQVEHIQRTKNIRIPVT